jgi:methionine-rich copper-binding protein CopC
VMISRRLHFAAATVLAISSALGISVGTVFAHAQYTNSTPPANATVASAPTSVQINFSQELSSIKITITGPHGSEVTTAPANFDLELRQNASVPMQDDIPGHATIHTSDFPAAGATRAAGGECASHLHRQWRAGLGHLRFARRHLLQATGGPRQIRRTDRRHQLQLRSRRWRGPRICPGGRNGGLPG